jgi:hypothetical protein
VGELVVPLPYIYSFVLNDRVKLRLIDFALFIASTLILTLGMIYSNYLESWLFVAAGMLLFAFSIVSILISIFNLSSIRLPRIW